MTCVTCDRRRSQSAGRRGAAAPRQTLGLAGSALSGGLSGTVEGGLGYLAVSFAGLNRYDGWLLEQLNGESWEPVDQSVWGNDFWQSSYHEASNSYTLTYNVKGTASMRYRLRWSSPQ